MARGRKSKASLEVVQEQTPSELTRIIEPPGDLTADQGDVWRGVMASSAGDFIASEAFPVLSEYCRAVVSSRQVAQQIDEFEPEWSKSDEGLNRWKVLLQMHDRLQGRLASLATKLRSQQRMLPFQRSVGFRHI